MEYIEGFWEIEFLSLLFQENLYSYTAQPIVVPILQSWYKWYPIVITLWNNDLLYNK